MELIANAPSLAQEQNMRTGKAGKWFIIIGFTLSGVIEIGYRLLGISLDLGAVLDNTMGATQLLIMGTRNLSFLIALSTLFVYGIRNIRRYGCLWKWLALPLSGALIAIVSVSVIGYMYFTLEQKNDEFTRYEKSEGRQSMLKKAEEILNDENAPISLKSKYSLLYAEDKYYWEGIQTRIFAPDGEAQLYVPSDESRKLREQLVEIRVLVTKLRNACFESAIGWSLFIGVCLLLGFLTPVRKATETLKL